MGVIATQRQRDDIVRQDLVVEIGGGDIDGFGQMKRIDRHIADIRHRERIEGRGARRHIVGTNEDRFRTDLPRTVTRARTVGGADIQGHADKANIKAGRAFHQRQSHHGGDAAEARHLVSAQGLMMYFAHRLASPSYYDLPEYHLRPQLNSCRDVAHAPPLQSSVEDGLALLRISDRRWHRPGPRPASLFPPAD